MTGDNDLPKDAEWTEADGEGIETERLALRDDEERLPWLESSDDDGYTETGGGMASSLKLGVMALAALVALVGGIYWLTHRGGDGAVVADGSMVAADPKPYKDAPKDPGGKTFDGTGDTSFAVSEGKTKPATVASGAPAAAAIAPPPAKPGTAPALASGAAPAAPAGGTGVQVGAFSSKEAAETGWTNLVGKAGGALAGVSHRVIAGTADNGTIYRLQAVPGDAVAANALCSKLKAAGVSCQVK